MREADTAEYGNVRPIFWVLREDKTHRVLMDLDDRHKSNGTSVCDVTSGAAMLKGMQWASHRRARAEWETAGFFIPCLNSAELEPCGRSRRCAGRTHSWSI